MVRARSMQTVIVHDHSLINPVSPAGVARVVDGVCQKDGIGKMEFTLQARA